MRAHGNPLLEQTAVPSKVQQRVLHLSCIEAAASYMWTLQILTAHHTHVNCAEMSSVQTPLGNAPLTHVLLPTYVRACR